MDENATIDPVPEITVNAEVLKWARKERDIARVDAARLLGVPDSELAAYEDGTKKPNVTFLRRMSNAYEINFVSLLLPAPPPSIPKLHDFRTIGRQHSRSLSLNTVLAIQDVRDALEAFTELRASSPALVSLPRLDTVKPNESAEELAERQRRKLGIELKELKRLTPARARDMWRERIESLGVFVYLKPMNLMDCRGFAMMRDGLAAICVNDKEENPGAESFTILHEYCHLLLRSTGISDQNQRNATEDFCNRFAGYFLIPLVPLRGLLKSPSGPTDYSDHVVQWLARTFRVSNRAMALQLERTRLAPKGFYRSHTAAWDMPKPPKPGQTMRRGQSAVDRAARAFGRRHTKTVLKAYTSGYLSGADAHGLLDVPIRSFNHLEAAVE